MIEKAQAVVGTVSPLDPRYLINYKGVTAWHALYVLALINDREGLRLFQKGAQCFWSRLPSDELLFAR